MFSRIDLGIKRHFKHSVDTFIAKNVIQTFIILTVLSTFYTSQKKFASICSKKPDLTLYSEYQARSHLVPSYYNSFFFHDHLNWASHLMKRKLPKNIKSWKIIVIGIWSTQNQRNTVACSNPPTPGCLSSSHQIDDRRSLDGDISQYCVVV